MAFDFAHIVWPPPVTTSLFSDIDIVFVHGLNPKGTKSNALSTWTHENGTSWPKTLLPKAMPWARIILIGYNSSVVFNASTSTVRTHAMGILNHLIRIRQDPAEQTRPIIFVCHSLGGIVVKQILVHAALHTELYESIRKSTVRLMFFGTPHGGGNRAAMANTVASVISVFTGENRNALLSTLKDGSLYNEATSDDFNPQMQSYEVVSFFEQRKVDVKVLRMKIFPQITSMVVVDRHAAKLGKSGEIVLGIDADHRNMCKFSGGQEDRSTYEQVLFHLLRMAKKAGLPHSTVQEPIPDAIPLEPAEDSRSPAHGVNFHFSAPERNPHFVGRDDIVRQLDDHFRDSTGLRRVALFGIGGIGKTQCAIQYCQAQAGDAHILWINAQHALALTESFKKIAELVKLKSDNPVTSVKRWMRSRSDCVIVFDNVENLDVIQDALPPAGTHYRFRVLITTRAKALVGSSAFPFGLYIDLLSPDATIRLFVLSLGPWTQSQQDCIRTDSDFSRQWPNHSTDNSGLMQLQNPQLEIVLDDLNSTYGFTKYSELMEVAILTGMLPLAVVQCASYLRQCNMSYRDYIRKFKAKTRAERYRFFRHKASGSSYKESIMTTWEVSFDRVVQLLPDAGNLLVMMGFLERTANVMEFLKMALMPLDFWARSASLPPNEDVIERFHFLGDREYIVEQIGLLGGFSLVSGNLRIGQISMHPMVHEWTHLRLTAAESQEWTIAVIKLLYHRLPPLAYSIQDRELPKQAEVVLSNLQRCKELVKLYILQDTLPPEIPIFFLEAYLWYHGAEYLDLAEQLGAKAYTADKDWVNKLICCTRIHEIVQNFQGSQDGVLDRAGYKRYSDKLAALSKAGCRAPAASKFVLTEAIVAYRMVELLEKDLEGHVPQAQPFNETARHVSRSRRRHSPYLESPPDTDSFRTSRYIVPEEMTTEYMTTTTTAVTTQWLPRSTRAFLDDVPDIRTEPLESRRYSPTQIDLVASAIIALCIFKDLKFQGDSKQAFEWLFTCRKGAMLDSSRQITELSGYFRELCNQLMQLSDAKAAKCWMTVWNELLDNDAYGVVMDHQFQLDSAFLLDKAFFAEERTRLVKRICLIPELLRFNVPAAGFENRHQELEWLEMRVAYCRSQHGPSGNLTLPLTERFAQRLLSVDRARDFARASLLLEDGYAASKGNIESMMAWIQAYDRVVGDTERDKGWYIATRVELIDAMFSAPDNPRTYAVDLYGGQLWTALVQKSEHTAAEELCRRIMAVTSPNDGLWPSKRCYLVWIDKLAESLMKTGEAADRVNIYRSLWTKEKECGATSTIIRPLYERLSSAMNDAGDIDGLTTLYRNRLASLNSVMSIDDFEEYQTAARYVLQQLKNADDKHAIFELSRDSLAQLVPLLKQASSDTSNITNSRLEALEKWATEIKAIGMSTEEHLVTKDTYLELFELATEMYSRAPRLVASFFNFCAITHASCDVETNNANYPRFKKAIDKVIQVPFTGGTVALKWTKYLEIYERHRSFEGRLLLPFGNARAWTEEHTRLCWQPEGHGRELLGESGYTKSSVQGAYEKGRQQNLTIPVRHCPSSVSLPIGMTLGTKSKILFATIHGRIGFEGGLWLVRDANDHIKEGEVITDSSATSRVVILWTRFSTPGVTHYIDVTEEVLLSVSWALLENTYYSTSFLKETSMFLFKDHSDITSLKEALKREGFMESSRERAI